jgi:hypothetical protein
LAFIGSDVTFVPSFLVVKQPWARRPSTSTLPAQSESAVSRISIDVSAVAVRPPSSVAFAEIRFSPDRAEGPLDRRPGGVVVLAVAVEIPGDDRQQPVLVGEARGQEDRLVEQQRVLAERVVRRLLRADAEVAEHRREVRHVERQARGGDLARVVVTFALDGVAAGPAEAHVPGAALVEAVRLAVVAVVVGVEAPVDVRVLDLAVVDDLGGDERLLLRVGVELRGGQPEDRRALVDLDRPPGVGRVAGLVGDAGGDPVRALVPGSGDARARGVVEVAVGVEVPREAADRPVVGRRRGERHRSAGSGEHRALRKGDRRRLVDDVDRALGRAGVADGVRRPDRDELAAAVVEAPGHRRPRRVVEVAVAVEVPRVGRDGPAVLDGGGEGERVARAALLGLWAIVGSGGSSVMRSRTPWAMRARTPYAPPSPGEQYQASRPNSMTRGSWSAPLPASGTKSYAGPSSVWSRSRVWNAATHRSERGSPSATIGSGSVTLVRPWSSVAAVAVSGVLSLPSSVDWQSSVLFATVRSAQRTAPPLPSSCGCLLRSVLPLPPRETWTVRSARPSAFVSMSTSPSIRALAAKSNSSVSSAVPGWESVSQRTVRTSPETSKPLRLSLVVGVGLERVVRDRSVVWVTAAAFEADASVTRQASRAIRSAGGRSIPSRIGMRDPPINCPSDSLRHAPASQRGEAVLGL